MKVFFRIVVIIGVGAGTALLFSPFVQETEANGSVIELAGFAWSENVGWISFSCANDHDENTPGAQTCQDMGGADYKVQWDQDSDFLSGYAWSEAIGWISFNHADTGDPPGQFDYSGSLQIAKVIQGNLEVRGWARALAGMEEPDDGWDGWLKLKKHDSDGGPEYGVTYIEGDGEFHGWAWGSDVVGWVSFNCAEGGANGENVCSTSDYQVTFANSPPTAAVSCDPSDCDIFTSETLTLQNDSTDPDDNITSSTWSIFDSSGILVEGGTPCATNPTCNWTVQTTTAGAYTAQLEVQDAGGLGDSATQPFTIRQDVVADFDCSLDQESWQDCGALEISQGETLHVRDISTVSDGATSITSRTWQLNGEVFDGSDEEASVELTQEGNTVTLEVQDDQGRQDSETKEISAQLPFSEFLEISPF